jgi:hypothetical protein
MNYIKDKDKSQVLRFKRTRADRFCNLNVNIVCNKKMLTTFKILFINKYRYLFTVVGKVTFTPLQINALVTFCSR